MLNPSLLLVQQLQLPSVILQVGSMEGRVYTNLTPTLEVSNNKTKRTRIERNSYIEAEECFKRAVQVEPPDAEALCQYAIFLWKVKNDLWGAEERYQQAVAAEPRNSYYRCTYANFLWSTGGEETCFLPSSTSPINNKKGEEV
ncbi:hypothetical protein KY285_024353 [Solanum tuberosum]|nr:hypothetical protein KY285_024353 [Solanum tuberosum]